MTPLRSHVVVGNKRHARRAGENFRTALDHGLRLISHHERIEKRAVTCALDIELFGAIDDIRFQGLAPTLEIPVDRRFGNTMWLVKRAPYGNVEQAVRCTRSDPVVL